jgi:hypothetical protein
MRRRNDLALERALKKIGPEPDPDFLRTLADEIRAEIREDRHARTRGLGLGLAVALTAMIMAAVGAVGAADAARSATKAVAQVVSQAFSAPNNQVRVATNTPAQHQYKPKCNSGRGNLSETETWTRQTNSTTLVNPHEGGRGPGPYPTDDCDPGNSGPQNRGGD